MRSLGTTVYPYRAAGCLRVIGYGMSGDTTRAMRAMASVALPSIGSSNQYGVPGILAASAACVCSAPTGNHEKSLGSCHWITWSARASTDCGIVRPRALAVLRLMTNSNFVGCSTGRSAGFVPLRILST